MTNAFAIGLLLLLLLLACILLVLKQYQELRKSYDALLQSYRNLENLNSTLRAQRHDFLNHLQVVYGLVEIEEYGELKGYLDPLYNNLMKTGKAIKTKRPAVNALLSAKSGEAENKQIDTYIEIKSALNQLLIPDWELCKILSNIIDNAMTALMKRDTDRKLWIDISEDRENYIFEIANNGPMIEEKMQKEIFLQGVTEKKEAGHGMGLFIVKNVLNTYRGTIELKSDTEKTVFRILLPKERSDD